MDVTAWVVYTFIAVLVVALAVAHYRWREPDGRGRVVLGVIRGATLALVVLLLFDPVVPVGGGPDRPVVALVDASLSMSLVGEAGVSRWEAAGEVLAGSDADRIQLFGAAEGRSVSSLEEAAPTAPSSRLAPALRSVLEAGAGRVVVITDGAVEDAAEVRRIAAESSVPIDVRTVGVEMLPNLSLEEVAAPRWLKVGEPSIVRFTVTRSGESDPALPDSATVTLSRTGRELARARVPVPPPGRGSTGELRFQPESAAEGVVRLDMALAPGGAVPDDDARSLYVQIAEDPTGVALVSVRPDQEPRFLLPVLERALGLPVRGWIRVSEDRFITLGTGPDAGGVATAASVRRALSDAALVVVHGVDDAAPAWVLAPIEEAERVLVFPSDPAPPLPVAAGPEREGEWYLSAEIPSSPVASLLAGLQTQEVPPLVGLRTLDLPAGYWAPLVARLGRRGEPQPVAAVGAPGTRRVAVALGDGYWRWAFASREGRAVYERLWSAVAGWILEDAAGVDRQTVRPVSRVVERGAAIGWVVPETLDSITLRIEAAWDATADTAADSDTEPGSAPGADGSGEPDPALDTTVVVEDGRAVTGSLPPGHYRYVARAGAGEAVEGAFTVESYASELAAAPVAIEDLVSGAADGGGIGRRRPLRSSALPYLVVVALLCAEWVLRRRWGLR